MDCIVDLIIYVICITWRKRFILVQNVCWLWAYINSYLQIFREKSISTVCWIFKFLNTHGLGKRLFSCCYSNDVRQLHVKQFTIYTTLSVRNPVEIVFTKHANNKIIKHKLIKQFYRSKTALSSRQ